MSFDYYIKKAAKEIINKNYSQARNYIHQSILNDDTSPKPNNLLGTIAELTGNLILAGKYYRAAYALDPTFKPAHRNLERITNFYYRLDIKNIDFGDRNEVQEESIYIIQYDKENIGHLVKKGCCNL